MRLRKILVNAVFALASLLILSASRCPLIDLIFPPTEPILIAIELSPLEPLIEVSEIISISASGIYDDGSSEDLTRSVVWSSSNEEIATISGTGIVTGHSEGQTSISASMRLESGSTTLTVTGGDPWINVSPTSGLETSEDAQSDTFSVVLNSQPIAPVTIAISSGDTSEGSIDLTSITFESDGWNDAVIVTVTGVDDAIDDGDVDFIIFLYPAVSGDVDYDGMDPPDVSVTNIDNDEGSGDIDVIIEKK